MDQRVKLLLLVDHTGYDTAKPSQISFQIFITINFLVDLAYAAVDPRLRSRT